MKNYKEKLKKAKKQFKKDMKFSEDYYIQCLNKRKKEKKFIGLYCILEKVK